MICQWKGFPIDRGRILALLIRNFVRAVYRLEISSMKCQRVILSNVVILSDSFFLQIIINVVRDAVEFVPMPLPALSRHVNFNIPLWKWRLPLLIPLIIRRQRLVRVHKLSDMLAIIRAS